MTEAARLVDPAMDDSGLRRRRRKFRQHSPTLMQATQQRHAPPLPVNYGKQLADSAVREIAAAIEWAVSGRSAEFRGGLGCMDWMKEPLTVGSGMRRVAAETAFPRVGDTVADGIGSGLSSTVTCPAGQLLWEAMEAAERRWIGGALAGGIGATVSEHAMMRLSMNQALPW